MRLYPLKTECGCPSGGGIKNAHSHYPSHGETQKERKKKTKKTSKCGLLFAGNKYLLQSHPTWSSLLDHYRKHKAVLDAADFIYSLAA